MKFSCAGLPALWGALAMLPPALPAAEVFLSPQLSVEVGYEDNRFAVATAYTNTESASFLRVTPGVDLHLFYENAAELNLGASVAHTGYLESSMGVRDGAEAHLEWWQSATRFEGGLRLDGGLARDDQMPEDDVLWFALTPSLRYILPSPAWQLTAQMSLSGDTYDSRLTADGEKQSDFTVEARPGLRWLLTRNLAVGGAFYFEDNRSNEDTSNYRGGGIALDASIWLTPRGQLISSIQWGLRQFPDALDEAGLPDERRDMPLRAGISYTYRLLPGLDLFCSGSWSAATSDQSLQDVEGWTLQSGVTFAQDFELPIFLAH